MNLGFLCSAGVLTNIPFWKEKPEKRREVLRDIKQTFGAILGHYEGEKLPVNYEDYYNAWFEFAEQHESAGNRLRRFVSSLRGRRCLNREQRDYLSALSTFFTQNLPDITSAFDRAA